ncbi:hypothetical protein [Nocardioides insulae]|uniref:hypothetical protein n=1 Tax=Nocardioides insulae TaxID=394734 RepID=UPI0004297F9B|nr:hypothetical protein [Nocardioides insulae]
MVARAAGVGGTIAMAAILVPGPAAAAPDGEAAGDAVSPYRLHSHLGEVSDGGSGALLRWLEVGTDEAPAYYARFFSDGETLELRDQRSDGRRLEVEVRVYGHADVEGTPSDHLDTDHFLVEGDETKDLGTPDGSEDIPEGHWVATRMRPEGFTSWSPWAYGRA